MKKFVSLLAIVLCAFGVSAQLWQEVNSGTQLKLNSISFGSDLVGYIGANDSTLLKTMDGGSTWTIHPTQGIQFSDVLPNIIQVDFVDDLVGFAMIGSAAYSGYLIKTTDGGDTWTTDIPSMCSPLYCYNFDADNSYVVGASCFGGKTIDKKVNGQWQSNTTYLSWGNEYLRSIVFYDTNFGITAGDSGTVHRTFDGGTTWDTVSTVTDEIIWDLQFANDSTIFAVVDSLQNTLLVSTDSGATWQEHMMSLTFFYPQLKALSGLTKEWVIAVGSTTQNNQGMLLWGKNNGRVWQYETAKYPLNNVTMVNDSVSFAVGDQGLILVNNQVLTGVQQLSEPLGINVFPNPATSQFSVTATQANIIQVKVFDFLGRLVFEVSSGFEAISTSSLISGIYYLNVHTTEGTEVQSLMVQ